MAFSSFYAGFLRPLAAASDLRHSQQLTDREAGVIAGQLLTPNRSDTDLLQPQNATFQEQLVLEAAPRQKQLINALGLRQVHDRLGQALVKRQ